jgi:hypothetical protein
MVKCIYCGVEIEGSIKEHQEQTHFGVKKPAAAPPTIPTPNPFSIETPKKEDNKIIKSENKEIIKAENHDTPQLPMEKPKKRYLDAAEIITLLQNTNKQFSTNSLQECPLTKENE